MNERTFSSLGDL